MVDVTASHAFAEPGTYFVTLRGIGQRQEGAETPLPARKTSTGCAWW